MGNIGFFAMVFMMNFDYTILKKLAGPLLIFPLDCLLQC